MSDNNAKKKLKLDAEVLAGIFSPVRSSMGIPNYYPTDYEFTKYYLCSNDESVKLLLMITSDENGKNAFELLISLIESKDRK